MRLLTPNDIRYQRFNTTWLREGYDIDEVDSFLDQVAESVGTVGAMAGDGSTSGLVRAACLRVRHMARSTQSKRLYDMAARLQEIADGLKRIEGSGR